MANCWLVAKWWRFGDPLRYLTALVVAIVAVCGAPHALADEGTPHGGGGVGEDNFSVWFHLPGKNGSPGAVSSGNGPSPYKYTWVPAGVIAGRGPSCDAGGGAPGWIHSLVTQDLAGSVVNIETRCVPLNPDGSIGAPPALPPVPAVGDIWRAALRQIDAPRVGVNPKAPGLTGLDTWLWYESPSELQVATSIGPWTITGTARVSEVTFDLGDGTTVTADHAGSEADPAAVHVYETKGTYEIVVTARWTADFVLTGPGLPARATPMGTAVLRGSTEYPVQEVRGLLVPDP